MRVFQGVCIGAMTTTEPAAYAAYKAGVHDGPFQADDVLCMAIVLLVHPEVTIIRTRDEQVLASCACVCDVGGAYNEDTNRYDHHQRGGAGERPNGIPYAACGLLWKNRLWAYDAISAVIPGRIPLHLEKVARKVDQMLIQSVDAIDTGHTKPNVFSFSAFIAMHNPEGDEGFDDAFMRAVGVGVTALRLAVKQAAREVEAQIKVHAALGERAALVPNPETPFEKHVLILDEFIPWQEGVLTHPGGEDIQLVVFPSADNQWLVQVVPTGLGDFTSRIKLPQEWGALRNGELQAASGVEDAVFCHKDLWIAGALTRRGAMKLAAKAACMVMGCSDTCMRRPPTQDPCSCVCVPE